MLALVALSACGGGGGSAGGDGPTGPGNTTVARIDLSPATPVAVVSGASTTFTAAAFTSGNTAVGASFTWASSNDAVASVAGGVVTGHLVGTAVITARSGSVTSAGVTVTVSAGAAAQLAVVTQPAGAAAGAPFATPPVVQVQDAAGNAVVGSTAAITAAVASGGGTLGGPTTVTAVAGVATFSGLSIAGLVGARTLTFTAAGLAAATSAAFPLDAGPAAQLAMRTQPVAGTAYAPFLTPAAVELRDAFGNVAASTAAVTATLASGGGTLGGATTVNASAGVATFTSLTVNGAAGARTLTFTAGTLGAVTSASFSVSAAPPAIVTLSAAALTMTATVGGNPVAPTTVAVTNTGIFPLTNLRVQATTYSAGAAGWLAATFPGGTSAPATLQLTATSAALPVGTYSATVVVAGDGAVATTSLAVTLVVNPPAFNAYGTTANKVSVVAIGSTLSPGFVTVVSGVPSTPDPTITFVARNTAIATVDATGKITAVAAGQVWVAALSTQSNSDSVLVIVPRASGPVLRTTITRFTYAVGDTITAVVQLDTRGATVGAVTASVSWPVWTGTGTFGAMTYVDANTTGSAMSPVVTLDPTVNVIRINGLSAAGVTGVVTLATIRFRVESSGLNAIYLNASEMLAADFTDLLATSTFTQYPVIVP